MAASNGRHSISSHSSGGTDDQPVDALGFPLPKLTASQEADVQACTKHRHKFDSYYRSRRVPVWKTLKECGREGFSQEQRAWIWYEASGAGQLREQHPDTYYESCVAASSMSASLRQIELDLPRTFPQHRWLQSSTGQDVLRRVLGAFSVHNVEVGYCQGLSFVAAFILLNINKQEERTFWLLAALVKHILCPRTYVASLEGCHVEMQTLGELIRMKLPRLHAHMERVHASTSIIATDWFLCLFCTNLPPDVAARVWDALFVEGSKVLFRVALALLKLHEQQLTQFDNEGEMMCAVKDVAAAYHHHERLMQVAFHEIGPLSMKTVNRIRAAKRVKVLAMIQARHATLQREAKQAHEEQERRLKSVAEERASANGAERPEIFHPHPGNSIVEEIAEVAGKVLNSLKPNRSSGGHRPSES